MVVIDVSGKAYTTSNTGSTGTASLQMSGESGSSNPKIYIHSARMGEFVIHEEDQFYTADHSPGSNYASITAANPGCQSFQVSDTNPITGASFFVHDSTGLPGTFDVHLRPDNSGAPDTGESLASITGAATPLNDVSGVVNVVFDTPFTPTTSTTYWLCIENSDVTFRVSVQATGSYGSGNVRHSGSDQSGADMHFHIVQERGCGVDMTLVTNAITALTVPPNLRVLLDLNLLDDAAGENLLTYSEQIENAEWTKTDVTVTTNSANAPDGSTTADTLTSTGDGSLDRIVTLEAGTNYIFSVYLKRNTESDIALQLLVAENGGGGVLTRHSIVATSDWQRVSVGFTTTDTGSHTLSVGSENSFASGESIFVWGFQLEKSAIIGPYRMTSSESTGIVTVANRDFGCQLTRDDGTTWTAANLQKIANSGTDRHIYAATVDLSAQPPGTDIRLKLDVSNGKVIRLHRWACQASSALTI